MKVIRMVGRAVHVRGRRRPATARAAWSRHVEAGDLREHVDEIHLVDGDTATPALTCREGHAYPGDPGGTRRTTRRVTDHPVGVGGARRAEVRPPRCGAGTPGSEPSPRPAPPRHRRSHAGTPA